MHCLYAYSRSENVRNFINTHPPVVLFTVTVFLLSGCLLVLSVYIEYAQLRNQDAQQDWNTILEAFSRLEFCRHANLSNEVSLKFNKSKTSLKDMKQQKLTNENAFSVLTKVHVKWATHPDLYAGSDLLGHVNARQLGIRGSEWQSPVDVTFHLPNVANLISHCTKHGAASPSQSKGSLCNEIIVPMCVTFQSSSTVFPNTPIPGQCGPADFPKKSRTTWDMYWHTAHSLFHAFPCHNDLFVKADYVLDPSLTLMLTRMDKDRIRENLHLCAFFMILYTLCVFVYAYLRGSPTIRHSFRRQSSCGRNSVSAAM